MKTKVFYVEDETSLGQIVKETLETQGFEVLWETDGENVLGQFKRFNPDICILDIMLPNVDGYSLCKQIRYQDENIPIIFLTAKVDTKDLVKGFEAGGTDYIRKPFSIEEVIARINNQLQLLNKSKHEIEEIEETDELIIGKYKYYPKRYELEAPSGLIKLSNRDGQVLNMLARAKNKITDRKELLLTIWGDDSFFNSRTLDVYIKKLRNYLLEDTNIEIQTLKGRGYLFLIKNED